MLESTPQEVPSLHLHGDGLDIPSKQEPWKTEFDQGHPLKGFVNPDVPTVGVNPHTIKTGDSGNLISNSADRELDPHFRQCLAEDDFNEGLGSTVEVQLRGNSVSRWSACSLDPESIKGLSIEDLGSARCIASKTFFEYAPKLIQFASKIDEVDIDAGGWSPGSKAKNSEENRTMLLEEVSSLASDPLASPLVASDLRHVQSRMHRPRFFHRLRPQQAWKEWVQSNEVQTVFGALIFLNAVFIGIDIEVSDLLGEQHVVFVWLESAFLVLFWFEIAVRIKAFGFSFFCDRWGPFDFGVTLFGSVDVWILTPLFQDSPLDGVQAIRILRILRLARLLRTFRMFKELASLVKLIGSSFSSMGYVFALLLISVYVSACFVTMLLTDYKDDPDINNVVGQGLLWAVYKHMLLVAAEGYIDEWVAPTRKYSEYWVLYFSLSVVIFSNFMVNLLVGLIVQKTMDQRNVDVSDRSSFAHESHQFKRTIRALLQCVDSDHNMKVNKEEFLNLWTNSELKNILQVFGVRTDVPPTFILTLFGLDEDRELTFEEFIEAAVRLCGSHTDIRAFMMQHDISMVNGTCNRKIGRLEKLFRDHTPKWAADVRNQDCEKKKHGVLVELPTSGTKEAGTMTDFPYSEEENSDDLHFMPPTADDAQAPEMPNPTLMNEEKTDFTPTEVSIATADEISKSNAAVVATVAADPQHRSDGPRKQFDQLNIALQTIEHLQESLESSLAKVRWKLLRRSDSIAVKCIKGHTLMPLVLRNNTLWNTEYHHWTCDGGKLFSKCTYGKKPASHVSNTIRYHCKSCHFDLCRDCYRRQIHRMKLMSQWSCTSTK